jgi:hypothetical protein
VFPAVSIVHAGGRYQTTLSVDAQDIPGSDGAFGDVVSGPQALGFTPDGSFVLIVDAGSEDVLAIDARAGVEAALLRPLPGHLPEGAHVRRVRFAPGSRRASPSGRLDLAALRHPGASIAIIDRFFHSRPLDLELDHGLVGVVLDVEIRGEPMRSSTPSKNSSLRRSRGLFVVACRE